MKLTIDSDEPLADVLRVVGSLYGVELSMTNADRREDASATGRTGRSRSSASGGRRSRRVRDVALERATGTEPRQVREWAARHGFEVSARGALPRAVRDAYVAAQG